MVVVLPAPFGPSRPSTSPGRRSNVTSCTAALPRKVRVTPSNSTRRDRSVTGGESTGAPDSRGAGARQLAPVVLRLVAVEVGGVAGERARRGDERALRVVPLGEREALRSR